MKKIASMINVAAVTAAKAVPAFFKGITEAQAKAIAIRHAGVDPQSVGCISIRHAQDDDRQEYAIRFYTGCNEYRYGIDMNTGTVNEFDIAYVGFGWAGA